VQILIKVDTGYNCDWRNIEALQPEGFKGQTANEKETLKNSIVKNGFHDAFDVWQHDGKLLSIDGVHRKIALLELSEEGYEIPEQLPCTYVTAANETEAATIILSRNAQHSHILSAAVMTAAFMIPAATIEAVVPQKNIEAWSENDNSITEQLTAEEDDFEFEEGGIETDIVLGDLFEIGEHRLLCGDSTDTNNLDLLLQNKKPELLLTDPPYGIDYGGMLKGKGDGKGGADKNGWKSYDAPEWDKSKPENGVLQYLCQITENQIIWGGNYFTDDLPPTMGWLIWDKGQRGFSLADGEMAWTSYDNALRIKEYARALANREEKNHPTQKPIEIMSWCFEYADRHSKNEVKLVLDTYLGSGSTMVTSHQLKRICYGMELDPKYCQVIIDRMRKLDPTLVIKKNGVIYE